MIGQLTDAGNTTTLAPYLELLQGAGMLAGLTKYSHGQARQRGSSPKLQVLNTALMSAQDHRSLAEARNDGDHLGGWLNWLSALTCFIPALARTKSQSLAGAHLEKGFEKIQDYERSF
jgi:hypothetical protein